MKLYTQSSADKLYKQYWDKGGTVAVINEGGLVDGLVICEAKGYKYTVITEVYLNAWSSAFKKRTYNKLPKKYQAMYDKWLDCIE